MDLPRLLSLGKIVLAASLLIGFAVFPARAGQGASIWDGAERWVGHHPTDRVGGEDGTLFDLPRVAGELPRMLTTGRRATFESYVQSDPVQRVEHYLLVRRCKPHDCLGGSVTVIMDTERPDMWIVFKAHDSQELSRCWIGTAKYDRLPQPLKASFTPE